MTAAPTPARTATITGTAEAFVPADTRTMTIVHNAMRRDLPRARAVLAAVPYPHDRQRVALAEHLLMITDFLHKHHVAEEAGLYPLVRARDAAAAGLSRRWRPTTTRSMPASPRWSARPAPTAPIRTPAPDSSPPSTC